MSLDCPIFDLGIFSKTRSTLAVAQASVASDAEVTSMRAAQQLFVTYRVAVLVEAGKQNTPRRAIWRPARHRQAAGTCTGLLPSLAGTIAGRVAVLQNWPIADC